MAQGTFVTAINCMDGRVQLPVIEFLKKKYHVDFVDMITEPGPIKILAENSDPVLVESIRSRVQISHEKHGSRVVAVVGHDDCAGNPVDRDTQLEQIDKAISLGRSWGLEVEFIRLYVNGKNWSATEI